MLPKLPRRHFIQYGTVAVGGMLLSPLTTLADNGKRETDDTSLIWYQRPLRIMHTVLREIDAVNYDAAAVIDYLKKGAYNTFCVNAGGIVDFFQNPLPAANINLKMGTRDILKEITTACKKENIRVIARVDFRGVEEHVYKKLPDWFMKDEHEQPVTTDYTKPVLYQSCYSAPYRNEYANAFITHVLKIYAVDGIWHNAPGVNGICYCPFCKKSYREFAEKDIPIAESATDMELDKYMAWKEKAADQCMEKIKKTVKSFGNDKVYTAEVFSIYEVGQRIDSGIDMDSARRHFDILVSVAFLTANLHDPSTYYQSLNYGSTIIKFLKSMAPEREAVVMYGGNGTSHRLVIDPPQDLKIWLWEILSAGGRFWNCYFTNVPTQSYDNRNAFNETAAYQFVKKHEKLLEQHVPVANIGIYYSRPTRISYRKKSIEGDQFGWEIRGVETVLMENHIPHDFILDDQVSRERLQKYKVIILPNTRCMSDNEIEILKDYVSNGGNLIATYATSLFDIDGTPRKDYGLSEVFGVSYAGKKENTRSDSYQYIVNKKHPLVEADSKQTELLFNAGFTALCVPKEKSEMVCSWVPAIINQPPDKAWVEKFDTTYPTIMEHVYGKGRAIYFANQPDLLSYTIGHPDVRQLLLRSVKYLAGDTVPVITNAPSGVHVGLTRSLRKPGEYILSLVNTISAPVRPVREIIPVHDIRVQLLLEGKSFAGHQLLHCNGNCKAKASGNSLELQVSRLEDFFSVHIRMNV